jgi:methionyl aminopeptidase
MKQLSGWFQRPARERRQESRPVLKSPREIELMRAAGQVVRDVLTAVGRRVAPGVTTGELNEIAERMIAEAGGQALFRGVETTATKCPFPAALCVSVNEEVVHGIPGPRPLKEGDIVSVDCGVRLRGYCGDAAETYPVGRVRPEIQRLLDVTRQSLHVAIERMKPGVWWSEIAREIQRTVESAGFSVVREFVGHGVGSDMHEEPKVPNFTDRKQRKQDFLLQPGLVIAVEPMVNFGRADVACHDPTGWTQVTKDGSWSAHFEHTVAVTETGITLLTVPR